MAPFFILPITDIRSIPLDSPWFAQLLGLLACAIGAVAFLQRQDTKLRLHLTLNGALLALHFMLLGATAAAINCLLCAIRTWVSGHYRGLAVMLFFLGIARLLVLPQVEHPIQLLTLIGTILSTYALFRLEGLALRLCMLASTLCWLTHNLWAGSMGGDLAGGQFFDRQRPHHLDPASGARRSCAASQATSAIKRPVALPSQTAKSPA